MSNYPPNINTSEQDAVGTQSTNEQENGATDSLGETSEELFGLRLEENQTCLARVIIQDKKIDIFGRRFAEDYAVINVPVKRGNGDIDMKNWMALGLTERDVDGTKVPYIVFGNHEINNIKQVSVDDHLALMEELKGKTEGLSQLATIEQTPDVDHQSSSTEGGGAEKSLSETGEGFSKTDREMLELFASYAKGKRDAQQRGDGSLSSYYSEKMGDCLNLMSEVAQQEAYNYAQTKYGDGNVAF